MKITKEQVEHVAKLARLAITDGEKATFSDQLSSILTYVEQLNQLDTSKVEPTSHVISMQNVFREDRVKESLPREEVLAGAPEASEEFFRVPRIIE
jgi:aspartyl-tRNA(Asn)/glutamyl-tRNA(Gln) amidotransferase subunit C